LDPRLVPVGEFTVAITLGQRRKVLDVAVTRNDHDAVTVTALDGTWLGTLAANGQHEGHRGWLVLQALDAGEAGTVTPIVRCTRCQRRLTSKRSRARGLGGWCFDQAHQRSA
jgi:Family of unknown function (DUF6011)